MKRINRTIVILAAATLLASHAACGNDRGEAMPPFSAECRAIADRFDAVLAGATGACRADADCACYNPVSPKSGCGGISDKKTTDSLRKLEDEFHRANCSWWVRCAPRACRPVCARGLCVNGR
jgi:hypothetical protein